MTAGFIAVANVQQLTEHWNKTQLGQLMADPVMEPFAKSLRQQFEDRWSGIHQRLGLTLDDLKEVPTGEVGVALIRPAPGEAALAIVVDVTGNLPKATELLERVSANLKKQGAKRTLLKAAEYPDPIIFFDVPPPKDNPEGGRQEAYYFLSSGVLCATDNREVIQGILARVSGKPGPNLGSVPALQIVMQRCADDAGEVKPQVRWFIHPLRYADVIRTNTPEEKRRKGKSVVEVMQNQGVAGIQGVGGFVDFASDRFEIIHRTAVYAPPPRGKALKMLEFPHATEYAPQRWVPRDVATYTTLYCDVLNTFDNFGPLFDELFGDEAFLFSADLKHQNDLSNGTLPEEFRPEFEKRRIALTDPVAIATRRPGNVWEIRHKDEIYIARKRNQKLRLYEVQTGIWDEVLESLEKDPTGPQINLREELVAHLGTRLTMVSDYQLPITPTCERLLYAVETTDEQAAAAAIKKLYQNDPTVKRRVVDNHVIWEIVGEEESEATMAPVVELPRLMPDEKEDEAAEEEEEETVPLLPHAAVTVAHGHLFVASHIEFLLKVLKPAEPREALGRTIDYRRVEEVIKQLAVDQQCAQMFSRTDEEYRPTYELIRQGKMPVSETLFGRLLNTMFGEGEKGTIRRQKIDGRELPEYDVVRRYLGPAGLIVTSEPDGWFFKGFTLNKESQ